MHVEAIRRDSVCGNLSTIHKWLSTVDGRSGEEQQRNFDQRAGAQSSWSAAAPEIGFDQKPRVIFHERAIDLHIFDHPLHIIARF
jgi:hypothetical protein